MAKKITMTAKPTAADDWVAGTTSTEVASAPVAESEIAAPDVIRASGEPIAAKRLTIDIPEALHARIKSQCALRRSKMADEIRKLLEDSFPENA